jgi:exodeoxyribonuclease VII large subunit
LKAITVSQLNNQIKSILESHFEIVYVKGEVGRVTYHSSGHLYFTLKDDKASVGCAMWKSNLKKMKFKLKEGDEVFVFGAVNLYVPRGEYKIIAQEIEPVGAGALQLAYERLKEELFKLGYFDENKKKPLPKFPQKIALVTSATGAALQDMLRIAKKRWLLSEFYLFDTLVQGEEAAESIARNVKRADEYVFEDGSGFDLIIVSRGGGSKEDLWPFNERIVAEAIYEAKTPVISAVGHEIDYLISDFVADKRAATPSNAMEIALPDKNEILMAIDSMLDMARSLLESVISKKEKNLLHLRELFENNSVEKKLDYELEKIKMTKLKYKDKMALFLNKKREETEFLKKRFFLHSPLRILEESLREIEFLKEGFEKSVSAVLREKNAEIPKKEEFEKSFLRILENKKSFVSALKDSFEALNPQKRERDGFAEIVKNGKRISLEKIEIDDLFEVENTKTKITAKALKKETGCFAENTWKK